MQKRCFLDKSMLVAAALAWLSADAMAQIREEDWRFLQEILEASNAVSPETARQGYDKCKDLGAKLSGMSGVDPIQRLYFEAEISHCIFYAMNNGGFSDETGDQCTYHLQSTSKFAEVVMQASGKPGYQGEMIGEIGHRIENAVSMGPSFGCKNDYEVFRPAIAEAQRIAALPPPPDPMSFVEEIFAAQSELQPETARDVQKKCEALGDKIVEGISPAQRLFFEAEIENCVAMAKSVGSYSDDTGNACDSHFRFASKLAEGLAASQNDVSAQMVLVPIMQGELEVAKRQGPELGCKQDYGALKSQ